MDLKIKYVKTSELQTYSNNAKKHTEEDVSAIRRSIEQFGFNDPIGIWHGVIVEGHGRLMAAQELGMETVPVIELDHLTDEQRRAYALAHNKTADLSGWDFNILDAELANLADIDMTEFGFEDGVSDEYGTDFELASGEKPEFCTMSFTLHEAQKEAIEDALRQVEPAETFGNKNKNGNCLYEVVREWAERKTFS